MSSETMSLPEKMSLLEKIQSMKMPFAELKGVTFVEAEKDRVVAHMLVRPELCTLRNTIHGGAVMAFADSVGAAATVGGGESRSGRRGWRRRMANWSRSSRRPRWCSDRAPLINRNWLYMRHSADLRFMLRCTI